MLDWMKRRRLVTLVGNRRDRQDAPGDRRGGGGDAPF